MNPTNGNSNVAQKDWEITTIHTATNFFLGSGVSGSSSRCPHFLVWPGLAGISYVSVRITAVHLAIINLRLTSLLFQERPKEAGTRQHGAGKSPAKAVLLAVAFKPPAVHGWRWKANRHNRGWLNFKYCCKMLKIPSSALGLVPSPSAGSCKTRGTRLVPLLFVAARCAPRTISWICLGLLAVCQTQKFKRRRAKIARQCRKETRNCIGG